MNRLRKYLLFKNELIYSLREEWVLPEVKFLESEAGKITKGLINF